MRLGAVRCGIPHANRQQRRGKSPGGLAIVLIGLSLIGMGATLLGCQPKAAGPPPVAQPRRVSALGRIEPETKIRKVAVSSSLSGDRIEEILVQEDTWVTQGTPLARLNSYGTLKASYDEANENVAVAQSKLAQVKAGAKQGEIRAQEFNVQSLERKLASQKLAQDQVVNAARARQPRQGLNGSATTVCT